MATRQSEYLLTSLCKKGLVPGHYRFACPQRGRDQFKRLVCASDQLYDDIDERMFHHGFPVRSKQLSRHRGGAGLIWITDDDLMDLKFHRRSSPLCDEASITSQGIPHPGSHRTKSGKTYADGAIIRDHS